MTKNVTIRLRAISDSDLDAILEMAESVSKRVRIVDMHDTVEEPPTGPQTKFSTVRPRPAKKVSPVIDPTNGDTNFGPAPCPICTAVDDHPCTYVFSPERLRGDELVAKKRRALQGTDRPNPHKHRLEANKRPTNSGEYKCSNKACPSVVMTWGQALAHKSHYFPHGNLHMIVPA